MKRMVGDNLIETCCEVLTGELIYETDTLTMVELEISGIMPKEFAITSTYPIRLTH